MLWFCGDGTADFDSEKSEKIAKIELTKVPIRAKIIEHVLGPFFMVKNLTVSRQKCQRQST